MTRPLSNPELQRILLVRLRVLGDVVFTTPIIRALRRRFPDAHLSYLVEPGAAPVVAGNPHLDELIVCPKHSGSRRFLEDFKLARKLRRSRFDVVIDLHGGPRAAWLAWSSGAPMRIGYTIAGRTWMYTHVVQRAPNLTPRHSVLNQADLLEPLGITGIDASRDPLEMSDDPAARGRVDARLAQLGITGEHTLAVMHVSASNPFKRWPAGSFAETAAALVRNHPGLHVVMVSGPSDQDAAAAAVREARTAAGSAGDRIFEGHHDLPELRELIARAAVYIGGDSGPLHVAATTDTPIVELLGPTLRERSYPWRRPQAFSEMIDVGALPCRPCDERRCVPGDFRCLTGIGVEQVVAAAERALETRA